MMRKVGAARWLVCCQEPPGLTCATLVGKGTYAEHTKKQGITPPPDLARQDHSPSSVPSASNAPGPSPIDVMKAIALPTEDRAKAFGALIGTCA
ncbi:hypothetical protein B0T16DRAFT_398996 [Cercophora newfieldiana]|uniref:Uncharacterized protein n=1 Tax=Cercophora newfieldiana TaxID=92897 RepID=A0AA40D0Z1_9PEZI|nr:hypothetical protein B0T16DRAFT_398996 [Cercophora newfieldiana]